MYSIIDLAGSNGPEMVAELTCNLRRRFSSRVVDGLRGIRANRIVSGIVGKLCRKECIGLCKARQIRKLLSTESTKTPVHAAACHAFATYTRSVCQLLDNCDLLLHELPQYLIGRL